jgi:toxin CptA
MSSPKFATPLRLEPRLSRRLLLLVGFTHVGALGVVLSLREMPAYLQLFLVSGIVLSLWHTARQQGWLQQPAAIRCLTWQADGDWLLETGAGETLAAQLLPSSYVHPWLVVLNLRLEDRRWPRSLVLLRDSLDETTFRRLRVRLAVEGCGEQGSRLG